MKDVCLLATLGIPAVAPNSETQFVSEKLSTLDTVLSTKTNFILKKYKDHGTILAEEHEDYREVIMP